MEEKKYMLSTDKEDELIVIDNKGKEHLLHRIIALKDIVDDDSHVLVKNGEKGGYVQSEFNLRQDGTCWVYGNAKVYHRAKVLDNAKVSDNADLSDHVRVYDNAKVSGNAKIFYYGAVDADAEVYGNAEIFGVAWIRGNAKVYDNAKVFGQTWICDNAKVYGDAVVGEEIRSDRPNEVTISGNAEICGTAQVKNTEINVGLYTEGIITGEDEAE